MAGIAGSPIVYVEFEVVGGGATYKTALIFEILAGLKHPFAFIAITLIFPAPAELTKALIVFVVEVPVIKEGNVH